MGNAIELLELDHRVVEELFAQFEATGDKGVALQICSELEVHTSLEEEIVYPVLRRDVDRDMAKEGKEEHDEADQLIKKIKGALGDQLAELVTELKAAIDHHVEEEEHEVFPEMEKKVGHQLDRLGDLLRHRKAELKFAGGPRPLPAKGAAAGKLLDLTKDELYERARKADLPGRSKMTKQELAEALGSQT